MPPPPPTCYPGLAWPGHGVRAAKWSTRSGRRLARSLPTPFQSPVCGFVQSRCILFWRRAWEEGFFSSLCLLLACCFTDHSSHFLAAARMGPRRAGNPSVAGGSSRLSQRMAPTPACR